MKYKVESTNKLHPNVTFYIIFLSLMSFNNIWHLLWFDRKVQNHILISKINNNSLKKKQLKLTKTELKLIGNIKNKKSS